MENIRRRFALVLGLAVASVGSPIAKAADRDRVDGPVMAQVVRIVDGDTILVSARPWPQTTVEVFVRLRGIDAPEMKARCLRERKAAGAAKDLLVGLIGEGTSLRLTNVSGDKYFGRVVADVALSNGANPAQDLVAAGLARFYDGGRKGPGFCNGAP
jgi:endonuclease YncB( thermonuclease family)